MTKRKAPLTSEEIERVELIAEIKALGAWDTLPVRQGRMTIMVKVEDLLVHASISDLQATLSLARAHARVITRAVALLQPLQFIFWKSLNRLEQPDHFLEFSSEDAVVADIGEGALDEGSTQRSDEADLRRRDRDQVRGKSDDHVSGAGHVGAPVEIEPGLSSHQLSPFEQAAWREFRHVLATLATRSISEIS